MSTKGHMDVVPTLPQSRPLIRADLEAMPDDGHRYELIDGSLVVTSAPSREHQRAVLRRLHSPPAREGRGGYSAP